MEKFKRKNDLGIDIEYTVVGKYLEGGEYIIYTDFYPNEKASPIGIELYAARKEGDSYVEIPEDEAKTIIESFNAEIIKDNVNKEKFYEI